MDGGLVCLNKPSETEVDNAADYHRGQYNCYGLNVMAICDSVLSFIYMAVAAIGRTTRAVGRLEELQKWIDNLPQQCFLVGDCAFILSNKIIVPFSDLQSTQEYQTTYSYFLSQLRISIGNVVWSIPNGASSVAHCLSLLSCTQALKEC
jgi:hypothetical protein